MNPIKRYTRWLHTQWPAGHVEKLPVTDEEGRTSVPGLFVVGDLRGVPLLKFSADTGAKAVRTIANDPSFQSQRADGGESGTSDVVIVGAGIGGMAAALEARSQGLDFHIYEAAEPFSTIVNFPKGKPIYTYPKEMVPAGELQVTATQKESLLDELRTQTVAAGIEPIAARVTKVRRRGKHFEVEIAGGEVVLARRVILALGRSGNFRKLGVPGEDLDKVYNRLHDPKDYCGSKALVVGGGDSALETAIALAMCGGDVTLSYRKGELSRPKPDNLEKLEKLAKDPMAEDVSVEEPSSERVTTSAGAFLEEHRKAGRIRMRLATTVREIREGEVELEDQGGEREVLENDVVFSMIGREPPLDFFRRSGVPIVGDWSPKVIAGLVAFVSALTFVYHWKAGGALTSAFQANGWFPFQFMRLTDASSLWGTLSISATSPSFWYGLAYTLAIVIFGIRRIKRRRTPYVAAQTWSLIAVQVLPLFLLPNVILPLMGHRGAFGDRHQVVALDPALVERAQSEGLDEPIEPAAFARTLREIGLVPSAASEWPDLTAERSWGDRILLRSGESREVIVRLGDSRAHVRDDGTSSAWIADELFPASEWDPHGREFWRASGFILAWPLFLWNAFTDKPLTLWLIIGAIQTFVVIPGVIYFWGKGAYCGWICSCGGLAETMGDAHRHKMPHGPRWNRLNMVGQGILVIAVLLLAFRIAGWMLPHDHWTNSVYFGVLSGKNVNYGSLPFPLTFLNYKWFVDLFLAGIVGTGLYFHFSGRVWCRFACPLAALMHLYARFSRFRILADKKKCISCNMCTSVCHQGIDIMNFANKGMPMQDPECVRCSACVQTCPTGVLTFGQVGRSGEVLSTDRLAASPVQMREGAGPQA